MHAESGQDLVTLALDQGLEALHFHSDTDTGLRALIAVHSTRLGPALGGCRCLSYPDGYTAMRDAIALARGMSLKAAYADMPVGGGKSVLIRPSEIPDRRAYFESFGDFIERLGGQYITSIDSGTTQQDLDVIATRTRHVRGSSSDVGDPSPNTAFGVVQGIRAAALQVMGRDDLSGLKVLVQGAGHVGHALVQMLVAGGARVQVFDINAEAAQRCADESGAEAVSPDQALSQPCDVFAPCALGGVLTARSIHALNCRIVAGSANNQLADDGVAENMHQLGMVYVPDFAVNTGGLIRVWYTDDDKQVQRHTAAIYERVLETLDRARQAQKSPLAIANEVAMARLNPGAGS